MSISTIITASSIIALTATIFAFICIVPEHKKAGLKGIWLFLHNALNFKQFILEKILHFLYVLATITCVVQGVLMLFYVEETYDYWSGPEQEWKGYYGILMLLLGPIVIRLVFEMVMMALVAIRNIIEINQKLKNQNATNEQIAQSNQSGVSTPAVNTNPAVTQPAFCKKCGTKVNPTSKFCINCGNEIGTPAPAVETPTKFCTTCGNKAPVNSVCPVCNTYIR